MNKHVYSCVETKQKEMINSVQSSLKSHPLRVTLYASFLTFISDENFHSLVIWKYFLRSHQIESSTIDGNVEFVHSQYAVLLRKQVSIQFLCPTKLLRIVKILNQNVYILQ